MLLRRGISCSISLAILLIIIFCPDSNQAGVQGNLLAGNAVMGSTIRVSVSSDGGEANEYSWGSSLSGDGRYVAFYSYASNLVAGDVNGVGDIFVRDLHNNQTLLVSKASDDSLGNKDCYPFPSISNDGRYIAFTSDANNLVAGDNNNAPDTFIHDTVSGVTEWISVNSSGHQAYTMGTTLNPISSDGRYVAFESSADNLVTGDDNQVYDVFVRDRVLGQTERVSVASDGTQGNDSSRVHSMSGDGRFITFTSFADNLISGETMTEAHIYLHDRQAGTTELVSVSSGGTPGNHYSTHRSDISDDGRFVVFESRATNLDPDYSNQTFDVFLRDRQSGTTKVIAIASDGTYGNDESTAPAISPDGRFVTYVSYSTNLVPGGESGTSYIYLHDRDTGVTERVSLTSSGALANDWSIYPHVSNDGRFITFTSNADNLVVGDSNEAKDIFLHDRFGLEALFLPLTIR